MCLSSAGCLASRCAAARPLCGARCVRLTCWGCVCDAAASGQGCDGAALCGVPRGRGGGQGRGHRCGALGGCGVHALALPSKLLAAAARACSHAARRRVAGGARGSRLGCGGRNGECIASATGCAFVELTRGAGSEQCAGNHGRAHGLTQEPDECIVPHLTTLTLWATAVAS